MNRKIVLGGIAACLLTRGQVSAQTAASSPEEVPLPPAPILARASPSAVWRIAYTYDVPAPTPDPHGKRTRDQPPLFRAHNIQQITVTKETQTYHEEISYDNGTGKDVWWLNGTQITQPRGGESSSISSGPGDDGTYANFRESDFPEVQWVNASNYIGLDTINGVKCFSFRTKISLVPENIQRLLSAAAVKESMVDATVWISVATRLPVQYTSKQRKETYAFGPPSGALIVPPEVAQQLAAWEKKRAQLLRPASLP